ncbi:hypothetical protein F5Y09DRAFT_122788 [Xylaria sp. FL1042]|nr:hypothetical protein F5Y09DRAFT_122788 [Xylaria sp. FL1042]
MADIPNTPQTIHESRPSPPPPPPPLPSSLPNPSISIGTRAPQCKTNRARKRARTAAQYGLADRPQEPHPPLFTSDTFKPSHMFFYGTLMDADVLQHITRYPTKPVLRQGWITGFKRKMWGDSYPTLIPLDNSSSSSTPKKPQPEQSIAGKAHSYTHGGVDVESEPRPGRPASRVQSIASGSRQVSQNRFAERTATQAELTEMSSSEENISSGIIPIDTNPIVLDDNDD